MDGEFKTVDTLFAKIARDVWDRSEQHWKAVELAKEYAVHVQREMSGGKTLEEIVDNDWTEGESKVFHNRDALAYLDLVWLHGHALWSYLSLKEWGIFRAPQHIYLPVPGEAIHVTVQNVTASVSEYGDTLVYFSETRKVPVFKGEGEHEVMQRLNRLHCS